MFSNEGLDSEAMSVGLVRNKVIEVARKWYRSDYVPASEKLTHHILQIRISHASGAPGVAAIQELTWMQVGEGTDHGRLSSVRCSFA